MRSASLLCFAVVVLFASEPTASRAQDKGKARLVEPKLVWDKQPHNGSPDLIRFRDRWYCAFREGVTPRSRFARIRILASADAKKWESVAALTSPAEWNLYNPKLMVTPDNELMVTAYGSLPGTSMLTMAWFSKDGKGWQRGNPPIEKYYALSSLAVHKGVAYSYSHGCICGSAQTIHIDSSAKGKRFANHYEQTFSGFFPHDASLVFSGEMGYCFLSRAALKGPSSGYLGVAKAPFDDWEWKPLNKHIVDPNSIRLPDGRIIVSAGLPTKTDRTSLCWFDPKTGTLDEFLRLPTSGKAVHVGLAFHKGELLVSYEAPVGEKVGVYVAKVELPKK